MAMEGYTLSNDDEEVAAFILECKDKNGGKELELDGPRIKVNGPSGKGYDDTWITEELDLNKHWVVIKRPKIYRIHRNTTFDPNYYQVWIDDDWELSNPLHCSLKATPDRNPVEKEIAYGDLAMAKEFDSNIFKKEKFLKFLINGRFVDEIQSAK